MGDIGASLRNARTRAGLEISEIEAETKIRAKYLRALENEEWSQLPGPTYVRSFMRTYGDALGLDGRMLVEEYKLHHERLSDQDLMPISPPRHLQNRRPRRAPPRGAIIFGLVAVLVGGLIWLGSQNSDNNGAAPTAGEPKAPVAAPTSTPAKKTSKKAPVVRKNVRVRIVATGDVFVCLQDATGKRRVDGATMAKGQRTGSYSSTKFLLRLGNGNARVFVDGKQRKIGDASPQAYAVTRAGVKRISLDRSPTCA